ncbi:MAG: disulfide bond formation protein B, partial [Candidatus Pelagibacter sp.]|nr:disulfide bond formation protein B [Candidatus Pelagibacter sp.]
MSKQINKKFLFTTLVFISLVLISAFVIEYKMDHKPCRLCLYERIPYFLAVF